VKFKYPYNKHKIFKKDFDVIKSVLKSNFLTQGPQTKKFEKSLENFSNSKFCVTFNSASSALLAACSSLGLSKNDNFWTVPNTYLASANAGLICGANVDFVDIDENTLNICPKKLEKKLLNTKKNKLPKLIIIVHFGGCSHDQEYIFKLSKKFGFKIIEDCSHSFGGKYKNFKIGSCRFSNIAITSFHPIKTITTGEGGALFTNNKNIKDFCISFRENGKIRSKKIIFKDKIYKQYDQIRLGYNLRLSDINSALGLSQLENINKIVKKRNLLAENYKKMLSDLPLKFQEIPKFITSTYHLFTVTIIDKKLRKKFHLLFKKMIKNGIITTLHYYPIHLHSFYKKKGFKINDFPIAEKYSRYSFSLPIYYDLKFDDQKIITNKIKKIIKLN